jgi:hypothetical protein
LTTLFFLVIVVIGGPTQVAKEARDMAWNMGDVWLRPGESESRWFTFGNPPSWQGPQVILPRALNAGGMLVVSEPSTEAQPITLGSVYWATLSNPSSSQWVNYSLTGGGVV